MELSPHTPAEASPPGCTCCLQEGGGGVSLPTLDSLHPERDKHGTGGLPNSLLPPIRAHWPLVPACSSVLRCGPCHWYPFPHYQLPPSYPLGERLPSVLARKVSFFTHSPWSAAFYLYLDWNVPGAGTILPLYFYSIKHKDLAGLVGPVVTAQVQCWLHCLV